MLLTYGKDFWWKKMAQNPPKFEEFFFFQTHQFFMISFSLGSQEYRMIPFLSFLDKVLSNFFLSLPITSETIA